MKGGAKKRWGMAHDRQADARLFDHVARMLREGNAGAAFRLAQETTGPVMSTTEERFRELLGGFADMKPAEIDREVRTVRARAEGREVVTVETSWRVKLADDLYWPANEEEGGVDAEGAYRFKTRGAAREAEESEPEGEARVVKVTLTRRRYLPAPKEG